MRAVLIAIAAALGLLAWRAELFPVGRDAHPRPLVVTTSAERVVRLDVVLPRVPIGLARLASGNGAVLVHYWAPWEFDGKAQALALDSLRREPGLEDLDMTLVCFDPFPSVARYVARHRLRMRVLLDHDRALAAQLPCPSMPFTYVLDRDGRVVVAQSGPVDWLNAVTRATLRAALAAPPVRPAVRT